MISLGMHPASTTVHNCYGMLRVSAPTVHLSGRASGPCAALAARAFDPLMVGEAPSYKLKPAVAAVAAVAKACGSAGAGF